MLSLCWIQETSEWFYYCRHYYSWLLLWRVHYFFLDKPIFRQQTYRTFLMFIGLSIGCPHISIFIGSTHNKQNWHARSDTEITTQPSSPAAPSLYPIWHQAFKKMSATFVWMLKLNTINFTTLVVDALVLWISTKIAMMTSFSLEAPLNAVYVKETWLNTAFILVCKSFINL